MHGVERHIASVSVRSELPRTRTPLVEYRGIDHGRILPETANQGFGFDVTTAVSQAGVVTTLFRYTGVPEHNFNGNVPSRKRLARTV